MTNFDWLSRNSLRLAELESEPLVLGLPPSHSREVTASVTQRRSGRLVTVVSVLVVFIVSAVFAWVGGAHHSKNAYASALRDMAAAAHEAKEQVAKQGKIIHEAKADLKLQAAIASDALNRSEAVATPKTSEPTTPDVATAFVYIGACGDEWRAANFAELPRCRSGDSIVPPGGKEVHALHNLTLRTELPSERGLGTKSQTVLRVGQAVKLVELFPMSKIADPPRLYWAKIELHQ